MKLTTYAIQILTPKAERSTRLKLALSLGVSERWIEKCLADNKPNGLLTTVTALNVIRKETGLRQTEILTEGVGIN